MTALINFKICDNVKECGGIAVCPLGAMYFDENKKTIVVDEKKCTSCGKCEKECPVGAIMVAKTKDEYIKFQKQIESDKRKIKDLFVDRYGAAPLSDFFMITEKNFEEIINKKKLVLIEVYNDDSIQCLLKSIPIKETTNQIKENLFYYKVKLFDNLVKKFGIKELPCLLIFRNNKLLGKIDGYYGAELKGKFVKEIKKILTTN